QTYTVAYEYDDVGRLAEITYPDGSVVERRYTSRGLLEELEYNSTVVDTRTYDDGGRLSSEALGNGLTVTRGYVSGGNLPASIANTAVGTYSYAWDANKNKTSETITGVMSGYGFTVPNNGYDEDDRLLAWERDDSNLDQSWDLSLVGNWDEFTENSVPQT